MYDRAAQQHEPSGLGITFTFLTALLLMATGMILFVYGISALFIGFGRDTDTIIHVDSGLWSVIHMAGGALMVAAGANLFVGRFWARAVGIGVASLFILGAILSFEEYVIWAAFLILLNVGIIWALVWHAEDAQLE